MDICIYHKNCRDGFAAALVVWMEHGSTCEYIAADYGDDPPDVKGKDVVIVDFSYPRDVLEKIHEDARSLVVLDHHKSAKEQLEGLDYCTFDITRSGCILTWKYIHGDSFIPAFLLYIEDRDIWKWEHPQTKAVNAGILTYPYDFGVWSDYLLNADGELMALIAEGEAIIRYEQNIIDRILEKDPFREVIGGYDNIPYINCTHYEIISDLLVDVAKKYDAPFAASYSDGVQGRQVSLRGLGEVDVSDIAKMYGGGGHHNAAGYTLKWLENEELGTT